MYVTEGSKFPVYSYSTAIFSIRVGGTNTLEPHDEVSVDFEGIVERDEAECDSGKFENAVAKPKAGVESGGGTNRQHSWFGLVSCTAVI